MRRLFVITCLLIVFLLIWAGVYARKQGFTNSWRVAIESDLASQGYFVDIGKLTLGAFRGLVAEDVKLFADEKREQQFAMIDDVYLDVGLERILNKRVTINTLDIENGRLTIPMQGQTDSVKVSRVAGRIALTENLLEVVRMKADLVGIDVSIKGALFRSPNEPSQIDSASREAFNAVTTQSGPGVFEQVVRILERFEFSESDQPTLKINFQGDIRELSEIQVSAALEASKLQLKNSSYTINNLTTKAEYDGGLGLGEISSFEMTDETGTLSASSKWHKSDRKVAFTIDSSADVKSILSFFMPNKKWGEVVFFSPPSFRAEGQVDLEMVSKRPLNSDTPWFPGQVIGDFQTDRFVVTSGIIFNSCRGDFSLNGEEFYLRNARADHKTGAAFLNCKYQPGKGRESLKFQTEVKMDPRIFSPFIKDEETQTFLKKWQFKDNSGVYIRAAGQATELNMQNVQARGMIALQDFKLNEVPFLALEADVEIDGKERWYRDVKLTQTDGGIQATMVYTDTESRHWEIKGGRSSVDIQKSIGAFSPVWSEMLSPFRFDNPPLLQVDGKIDGRSRAVLESAKRQTDLNIAFSSPGTIEYTFLGKPIRVAEPKGVLHLKSSLAHLHSAKGKLYQGEIDLEFQTPVLVQGDSSFSSNLELTNVDFDSLAKVYGLETDSRGKLNGKVKLSGDQRQADALNGKGTASITREQLFEIPTFKGLKRLVERDSVKLPKGRAEIDFAVSKGILTSDKIQLSNKFSGSGKLDISRQNVELNLNPGPDSGYEYRARGKLGTPTWETVPVRRTPALSER